MKHTDVNARLLELADPEKAHILQRFFKTGPGEYGQGDVFLGIKVPELRKLVKEFQALPKDEILQLLKSSFHEERLLAVLLLVHAFSHGGELEKRDLYETYLNHTRYVNNWDLVDVSAPNIVGCYLANQSKEPLFILAESDSLWERRIAIIATAYFIRQGHYAETLSLAEKLLADQEDLIHKAVGWMLREVGKRDLPTEERFLRRHYRTMPRTMLRYAIERFPEFQRQQYLKGIISVGED